MNDVSVMGFNNNRDVSCERRFVELCACSANRLAGDVLEENRSSLPDAVAIIPD